METVTNFKRHIILIIIIYASIKFLIILIVVALCHPFESVLLKKILCKLFVVSETKAMPVLFQVEVINVITMQDINI